jgi:putative ABC transport system permease protein
VSLLVGFGRLKPGVGMDQARAELRVLQHQVATSHPGPGTGDPDTTIRVVWLKDQLVANVRPMLWMLFGAVGFVLLIACANVASLLLARSASRAREFAVRAAIGAGRGRLIRQLLAESLVLAFVGGVLGAFLANGCMTLLARMSAVDLPRSGEIRLDGVVLGFTVALSIATGVLFGLAPSIGASRPDLIEALRASGEASRAAGSRRGTLGAGARGLLVVGQVALSIVLLIGAALLMESFARLHRVDPGFQASNLLTMKIALPPARYNTPQKRAAFFDELVNRLESALAVRGVAMAMSLPATSVMHTNIFIAGRPAPHENEPQMVQMQSITPGYFQTMGIPVRRGREFTARDNAAGAPPVMVINEALARRFWPDYPRGQDPVGQRILEGFDKVAGFQEVIGIVADVHEQGLVAGAEPEFYVPNAVHPPQTAYLALRTSGDPMRFVNSARSQTLAIDRDQPISDVRTMDDVLEAMLGARRLTLVLLAVFAGVALLLAVVGLYGVIAYSVAQRTQEVGIRRALGAQRSDILRLVLGQGLGLALAGVALGIGGAFALTRVMEGLLFHISPTDPATFAGIAILFVLIALAASYIPARRASRIDPMSALR